MKKYGVLDVLIVVVMICLSGIAHAGLTDGLVAYYPFNGNANDESGNGYDGNESGNLEYVKGVVGNSLALNKAGYVNVADFPELDNFSISLFFQINGLNNSYRYNNIVGFEPPNDEFLLLFFTNDSKLRVHVERKNSDANGLAITDPLELNTFYHLVFINDYINGKQDVYINGELVNTLNTKHDYVTGTTFKIGHENDGYNLFDGIVDEMRIYNRALSESEIRQLYSDDYNNGYNAGQ